ASDSAIEVKALLEVNISGDASKHGFRPAEMPSVIESLTDYKQVRIRGLMGMASLAGTIDDARRDFESLRVLRDRLVGALPPAVELSEISMGMSGDFEVAIEEGATIVRVGSALFEGLEA
ncbi:MAG TPA: alanine racemase, partial [Pirellulaceae bacterium]|nr:alanine racemase [Pirellulaceae bacterium]